ncbi:MerR family transcriptional regulator [Cryptosporangium aurantiacum]|uniref:MerR HTH family regulatory protein n=1 Tax=Cryptosporangium aurantiacum TaxID=134849 RepID=A0A1M7RP50_9ACTN|nr:MerR family transcriptional regulator [Cryptosporangium aurantiacum]SHN47999.1 MerR HTH family regulatory protein [Cryptosporangium aurantiacum]
MASRPDSEQAGEYRINDLARESGIPVRNIRLYQERRILPPPMRRGRVGWYSEAHLARLRLIARLLDRGYSLAHIGELISAWERGRDLADVLGLEAALTSPWSEEPQTVISAGDLQRMFGKQEERGSLDRAIASGMLRPDGTRFRVASPQLLDIAVQLVQAGYPLSVVMKVAEDSMHDIERVAERYVSLVKATITPSLSPGEIGDAAIGPTDDHAEIDDPAAAAALVQRLRPLARKSVDAMLAMAMENAVNQVLGDAVSALAKEGRTSSEPEH